MRVISGCAHKWRRARHEDLARNLGVRLDGYEVRSGRLQTGARERDDRSACSARRRGSRGPDRRLRVSLPTGAVGRESRRSAGGPRRSRPLRGGRGAPFIIWPGIEGYNYPFQSPYGESWQWLVEGVGAAAERAAKHGTKVFLEHKNSEPAMKILMRNVGMTLHVIHKLRVEGIDNGRVNMDWQRLIMNGESLAENAALLAGEGLRGHQHANDGWGTFDDDNMVGTIRFMETLELAVELRRAGYGAHGGRVGVDLP